MHLGGPAIGRAPFQAVHYRESDELAFCLVGRLLDLRHRQMLALDPDRITPLVGELGRILQYVEMLEELDLTGIPPISHGSAGEDVFRPDTPRDPAASVEALANAPDQADGGSIHADHGCPPVYRRLPKDVFYSFFATPSR